MTDIHNSLRACLQVGRLDKAAAFMRRLNVIYKHDAPILIETHNEYIGSLLDRIVRTKDQEVLHQVQNWFEVDLCGKGIVPNPITFALMIQAALQETNQSKIDRTVKRYLALADQAGIGDEVMTTSLNILSEQDLGRVTRLLPAHVPHGDLLSNRNPQVFSPHLSESITPEFEDHDSTPTPSIDTPPLVDLSHYEIQPVKQKGLGLQTLQKALSTIHEPLSSPPSDGHESPEINIQDIAFARQSSLEENTLQSALDRWRKEHASQKKQFGATGAMQSIGSLLWQWHEALVPLIQDEVRMIEECDIKPKNSFSSNDRLLYGTYLLFLKPEKLSAITILSCLKRMSSIRSETGCRIGSLVVTIGAAIQDESVAKFINKDTPAGALRGLSPQAHRKRLYSKIKKLQPHDSLAKMTPNTVESEMKSDMNWSLAIQARIGATLLSHLIKAAKMDVSRRNEETDEVLRETQPVFWNTYQYQSGKRVGVLRMNKALLTKLSKEPVKSAIAKHLPMLVEPVPWSAFRIGGYLRSPVSAVRVGKHNEQGQKYIRAASRSGDMRRIWDAITVLGKTPWRINRQVFEVMAQAWNTGEAIAKIPAAPSDEPDPEESEQLRDDESRKDWERRIREIKNRKAGKHSSRCFQNFQLEIARIYLNETFYFPHNVDFRGRAYPIPPYLNHMGADNCRGLLIFAEGKELGAAGLIWLKIHLANVFGFDKASLEDRRKFTEDRLTEIYDSATNALEGKRWWLEAEDPWQCLAACIELKNALDCEDPTKFVSHIPVHQDGTCNGLQHYAALGGDPIGAQQVNLEPGDRPSDVYSGVAQMVQSEIAVEATQDNEFALLLNGKLTRKVVKQTVMTNVYGVTFMGAQQQVRRQLQDIFPDFPRTREVNLDKASSYVAIKIFKSLTSMFTGAHDIQHWLGECARRICESLTPEQLQLIDDNGADKTETSEFLMRPLNRRKAADEQMKFKSSVIWTTPLGMPVVQPYRKSSSRRIKTTLQDISIIQPSTADPVHTRKQYQAFPPNFIHSLDACHMSLSALKCNELGLTFASVHDSFWTHAGNVPILNRILRDAFVRMHSDNIIGRLAEEFTIRYKDHIYLAKVKPKSPLGKKILALRKEQKKSNGKYKGANSIQTYELMLERRRLRLLASNDPLERAEGESIITPGRLLAEASNKEDFMLSEELVGSIGKIDDGSEISSGDGDVSQDVDVPFPDYEPVSTDAQDEVKGDMKAEKEGPKKRNKKESYIRISVWTPLTFPPVPQKVCRRIKDTTCFCIDVATG